MLWLAAACADSRPVSYEEAPDPPALEPAPSRSSQLPLATATPEILRPPTGTPTPIPTATAELAMALPAATVTPMPAVVLSNPNAGQPQPVPVGPTSLTAGVDCELEIASYNGLKETGDESPAYRVPVLAACLLATGDVSSAMDAYERALESGPDLLTEVLIRQGLGDLLAEIGDYQAAVSQYDAILAVAETQISRGRALYQAGQAELLAGDLEQGYGRFMILVEEYPESAYSYIALTELLAAGYSISDYQQGLIAYNAQAYDVSAATFSRVIESIAFSNPEATLYLAWSLEKLGNVDGALAQLDSSFATYEVTSEGTGIDSLEAARNRIERAAINERAGRNQAALDDYKAYLTLFPFGEDAALASWRSAALFETMDEFVLAKDQYLAFARTYAEHQDAAQALFRAGYLSWEMDQIADAGLIWQEAAGAYPEKDYGAASLLWLLKTLPASQRTPYEQMAQDSNGLGYYAPRAGHVVNGIQPFTSVASPNLDTGDTGRDFAESWLRRWLGLVPGAPVAGFTGDLAADPRLEWAETLWLSGSSAEASRQFEMLRTEYADDGLASYQLALHFRDIGLYKLSILAALSVMQLAGVGAADAPRFIARLAYPAYHADLVTEAANRYKYDPLLQLALIHEESYFDERATSPLGARGLSQILPETGSFIAGQLGWFDYDANALLRPDTAIEIGGYYLAQQLTRYDGNVAAALAAYNAGPGFADQWFQIEPDDYDRFLEVVDFPETQRFLKQIYIVYAIYRFLYT